MEKNEKNYIENGIPGYYETVKGINWISGYAVQRLLTKGPTAKFYMGLKDKPGVIYDVAYSAEETVEIGARVLAGMHLSSMLDITVGELSAKTAASLYYIAQKEYPKPIMNKIYKIEIRYTADHDRTFDEWAIFVKGRLYRTPQEKIAWYKEWKSAGN